MGWNNESYCCVMRWFEVYNTLVVRVKIEYKAMFSTPEMPDRVLVYTETGKTLITYIFKCQSILEVNLH